MFSRKYSKLLYIIFLVVLTSFYWGCGEDSGNGSSIDTEAPTSPTNLNITEIDLFSGLTAHIIDDSDDFRADTAIALDNNSNIHIVYRKSFTADFTLTGW